MKKEFVEKFMSVYNNELFPNKENNYEKIKTQMENFNKPNAEVFTKFPFARQKFARFLTVFGAEIFYVWDKYIITMYVVKIIVCLICGLIMNSDNMALAILGGILMMFSLFVIQVIVFLKMPKICKKYNNKLLLKALDNPKSVESRIKYFDVVRKIFFLIRSKEVRQSLKEIRDGFYIN